MNLIFLTKIKFILHCVRPQIAHFRTCKDFCSRRLIYKNFKKIKYKLISNRDLNIYFEMESDLSLVQREVLVSTDIFGQFWNVCIWDFNTGTNLQTYKNSSTVPHGLVFLQSDYMLCAAYNKPHIVCWNLKGKVNQNTIPQVI